MDTTQSVSPKVFQAMQGVNVGKIKQLSESELRPVLTCLVRMSLCQPLECSKQWLESDGGRKEILKILAGLEVVNSIVALLSVDFSSLEHDAKKELQMRQKVGEPENLQTSRIQHGLIQEFEKSDSARRLRLVISELLFISSNIKDNLFVMRPCELFESKVFLDEVADVLCIAQAELPSLLPIEKMANILLRVKFGPELLCRLVANFPDSFNQVCRYLVMNGERQDEETIGGRRRTEMLRMLVALNPSQALSVRYLAVEHCRLPGLAVALTLDYSVTDHDKKHYGDVVSFISGLLLSSNTSYRNWFAQFVNIGNKLKGEGGPYTSILVKLRKYLLEELKHITSFEGFHGPLNEEHVVEGSALMRLFCALKGIAGLKFKSDEIYHLLRLLTSHPPPTEAGIRFICISLCMLLACPSFISGDEEQVVLQWINWLVQEGPEFERKSGVSASFSEMLLLMAIHFHANQMQATLDLICSTLGMKIPVRINSLAKTKLVFTQEIFTEKVLTAHAVNVSVTPSLSGNISGFLPVHCIFHLLKSRAFSKHQVLIKDWIYRQIMNTAPPLHPLLPPLLDAFVNSTVMPTQVGSKHYRNDPLSESEILSAFSSEPFLTNGEGNMEVDGCHGNMTAQLLMLYCVLLYEDCLLTNAKHLLYMNQKLESYSKKLLAQIPIKHLLHEAQSRQTDYGGLYPSLLRLMVTHYPHLCLVEDWMDHLGLDIEEPSGQHTKKDGSKAMKMTPHDLQEAFKNLNNNFSEAVAILERLKKEDAQGLILFAATIVEILPKLLEPDIPMKIINLCVDVWKKINVIIPRKMKVMTINALSHTKPVVPFTEEDVTMDPLITLRCKLKVFRCPPILEIVLQILTAYLAASRAFLAAHLQANPTTGAKSDPADLNASPSDVEREELKGALIAAQESAAVQILLEICLPFENEETTDSQLSALREVRCQVCCVVHQLFIADPNLAKLVHFQGYASELLPVTVTGVPSMHICLDFIPELLSQPQLNKQIFAVQLVSHLCLQFALPKALSAARLGVNVMTTLLTVLTGERWSTFFSSTIPCLSLVCQAFPPMYDDVTLLLTQVGRMAHSRLAILGRSSLSELKQKKASFLSMDTGKRDKDLLALVEDTFTTIVQKAAYNTGIS